LQIQLLPFVLNAPTRIQYRSEWGGMGMGMGNRGWQPSSTRILLLFQH